MFDHVQTCSGDFILSLNEDFHVDPRSNRVNLSIDIYVDDVGKLAATSAVRHADTALLDAIAPRSYLSMAGHDAHRDATQALVTGSNNGQAAS